MLRRFLFSITALFSLFFFLGASDSFAAVPSEWKINITLKHEYYHFVLPLRSAPSDHFFQQKKVISPQTISLSGENPFFCSDDESEQSEINESEIFDEWEVNGEEISNFLQKKVSPKIGRAASNVTISRDEHGNIAFDGYADFGEELDIEASTKLIAEAIYNGVPQVHLAVIKTDPVVTVLDEELREKGITSLLSVGRSDFTGSPRNRVHNIGVGANRFNGLLIEQGQEFSFNQHLGRVDGSTGYLKELVIVGPKTIPEYGGGLCQVSSTTYRGAMLAGFPIVERKNHSYSVVYYHPVGSDATIYPGSADFKFMNDTPGAILIQTQAKGEELYFHYYGTKDERQVSLMGPYTWGYVSAPAPKHTTSNDIPVGTSQQLSGYHPGLSSSWYRKVQYQEEEQISSDQEKSVEIVFLEEETPSDEPEQEVPNEGLAPKDNWEAYHSKYQARGVWVVTGVSAEESSEENNSSSDGSWIAE